MENKYIGAGFLLIAAVVTIWLLNSSFALISAASTISVIIGIPLLGATIIGTLMMLPYYKHTLLKILPLILFLLFTTSGCGWKTIPPGYVGIVVNQYGSQKGVEDFPAQVGRITYNPFTSTVYMFPTFQQNVVWTKSVNEGSATDESITFNGTENAASNVKCDTILSVNPWR